MTKIRRYGYLLIVALSILILGAATASPAGAASRVGASAAHSDAGWKVGTKLVVWTYGTDRCVRAFRIEDARLAPCAGYPSEEWKVRSIHTVKLGQKFSGYQLVNSDGVCLRDSSTKNGAPVHGASCDNASRDHAELWCVLPGLTDAPQHSWEFFNARSRRYLYAHNNKNLGAPLETYDQNHAPSAAGKIFGDRR